MKANELVKQLKILGDSISVKTFSFLPIAEMLGVEKKEGEKVLFSVTNREVTSITLADIPFEGVGSVSINFKEFTALLRKLKNKEISLSYKEGVITLTTDSSSHDFPAYVDTGDGLVPATPIPKEGEKEEIVDLENERERNKKLFSKMLQLTDSSNPKLNNLLVSKKGVYATDNYIIAKVMMDTPITKDFLIPYQIGKSFLGDEKIVQYAEDLLSITKDNTSIYCRHYDTKDYPSEQIDGFFVEEDSLWEASSTELRDAINEMTYNTPEVLSFQKEAHRLWLRTNTSTREISIEGSGEDASATIATEHLKTLLSLLDGIEDEIKILIQNDMLHVYSQDNKVKIVVLGVREG